MPDFGQVLSALLGAGAQGVMTYYGLHEKQKRADQDAAFQQARIDQANAELTERHQERIRDRYDTQADRTADSLEQAGIVGGRPALDAIASTAGNRVQGQEGATGAMQHYATSALQSLAGAGDVPDDRLTDLGEGRYFVPDNLGKPERFTPYGPEWLAGMEALIRARGDQQRQTNREKPVTPTAQSTSDRLLQQQIDRYVAESGGDPNKAMTSYYQANRMGSAQSPEAAQALGDLSTRFNAAGESYRNKNLVRTTRDPVSGSSVTTRGNTKIPLSAVSRQQRRLWAREAGVPATNDPQNISALLDWIRTNHPEVDLDQ